jgi:anti-sigma regulatory factor (Ser/Thr protein kinase)
VSALSPDQDGNGAGELRLSALAMPDSVPRLRRQVHDFAVTHGVAAVDDVALAVSEALTNAVVHAYPIEPGEMRVLVRRLEQRVVIVVEDEGQGLRPRPDSPGLGLGLPLMAHVAHELQISAGPDGIGTRVLLSFPVQGRSAAGGDGSDGHLPLELPGSDRPSDGEAPCLT